VVLVDTSVLIDYFKVTKTSATQILDRLIDNRIAILIGDLMLTELLQGTRSDHHAKTILKELREYQSISIVGLECAIQAAQNYRILRSFGVTIRKTIDCLIATRCIMDDIPLLYTDRDFDPFVTHLGLKTPVLP
jgi:predicted nucleic acid-binding protein